MLINYGGYLFHAPNIKYRKNEVFIDCIEAVSATFCDNFKKNNNNNSYNSSVKHFNSSSSSFAVGGMVAASIIEYTGKIVLTDYLSGTPELRIGFANFFGNESHKYIKWNASVRRIEVQERNLIAAMIPPDGKFTLCEYVA